jgi:hypothetical protein
MSLPKVNHQKVSLLPISLIEMGEAPGLTSKRGSGIATEDQNHGTIAKILEGNHPRSIRPLKREFQSGFPLGNPFATAPASSTPLRVHSIYNHCRS